MACYEYRLICMGPQNKTPVDGFQQKLPKLKCTVQHMVSQLPSWGLEGWQIVSDLTFPAGTREMLLMREIPAMQPEAAALEI